MLAKRFVSAENQWRGFRFKEPPKKLPSAKKHTKEDPLVIPLLLQLLKKFGLVRDSNPQT